MRKFEYETGHFISIDPLWAKYYGWSPYQYSMNSPVMLVDEGGEKVGAVTSLQDNVINMVEPNRRNYVQFDRDGMINQDKISMISAGKDSPIFNGLQRAVLSDKKAFLFEGNSIDVIRKKTGETVTFNLNDKASGVNKKYIFGGYTFFPNGVGIDNFFSKENYTTILISSENNEDQQTVSAGKEILNHFLNYIEGKTFQHSDSTPSDKVRIGEYENEKAIKDNIKK